MKTKPRKTKATKPRPECQRCDRFWRVIKAPACVRGGWAVHPPEDRLCNCNLYVVELPQDHPDRRPRSRRERVYKLTLARIIEI
jgi:hypothetical protein